MAAWGPPGWRAGNDSSDGDRMGGGELPASWGPEGEVGCVSGEQGGVCSTRVVSVCECGNKANTIGPSLHVTLKILLNH